MQCKERLEAYLRKHQVPYQLQHHAQAFSAQRSQKRAHSRQNGSQASYRHG